MKLTKPDVDVYILTSDGWNSLRITTFSSKETKSYDLQFFENCGQPIKINLMEIDGNNKTTTVIENSSSSIINIDVNQILQKIIPSKTKLWNVLDLNNIRNNYVVWFIENKTIKFEN